MQEGLSPMDEVEKLGRRTDILERNLSDVGKSITEIVQDGRKTKDILDELKIDRAVREEKDVRMNERFDRIEKKISSIESLGRWLLAAIGSGLVLAILNFIIKGGLKVV